jgi:excinuclease ABC subunit A
MSSGAVAAGPSSAIVIRGARVHNLRNVDLDIPRDRLVVLTGVSGSGKSSLAFDTVFAEGQRRYIECLSSYARQFLDQLERPDVDQIDGLPPTVAIDQKAGQSSPRSTVGTLTEINDYLRLLYSRLGVPHCPNCGLPIHSQTPEQMVATVLAFPTGRRLMVLAPLVRARKGAHAEVFQAVRRAGLIRARVDGEIVEVADEPPKLAKTKVHSIDAVVDRLVVREGIGPRLAESVNLALKLSEGLMTITSEVDGAWQDDLMSVHLACPGCGTSLPALEPRAFSFNSPQGACPTCGGLGVAPAADGEAEGDDDPAPCPDCEGSRLRPEARSVRVEGRSIDQVQDMAIDEARAFFDALRLPGADPAIAEPLLKEIRGRLQFLSNVGLGYLTLGRGSQTLSGGELQRVRLATQLGSGLVGVCYVLDEPTAGLHPRDTDRLLAGLRNLEAQGNSVLVVEHDEAVIRAADWIVDVGPGAGPDGGSIVATGTPDEIAGSEASITGRYLSGALRPALPRADRLGRSPGWVVMRGATVHNLKGDEVRIPLGALTCVTGVSGSGKSTLVHDVLARGFRRRDRPSAREAPGLGRIEGWEPLTSLVVVDQSPIGRSPRSTPATFTGVFDQVRRVFATTREARMRGYGAARFSFNAKGGRCEACEGLGHRRIPMQFLPDMFVVCEECQGKRFNRQTLEVLFKEKSIGDVLDLRVDEALAFFDAQPRVLPGLAALHDVGLGYLTLGQSGATLSGGEAQRVKLAAQLGRPALGSNLYILDEPTTGLHFADIDRLLAIFHRLADRGETLVVIEHNLDVVAAADWVVDLGPEAGADGGRVVAMGPPEEVARSPRSPTGRYLGARPGG